MKKLIAAVLICAAGQASALSCNFGDGAAAYAQAQGHGDSFDAAIGTLAWAGDRPNGILQMGYEGEELDVLARFTGTVIGPNGDHSPVDRMLRVSTFCMNGDCGYAHDGGEMLTFLHNTSDGVVMFALPCQSYPRAPDAQSVQQVQGCIDGGPCEAGFEY